MLPPVVGAPLIAGLFGKLPAHGDFVRRGWSDRTVEAIDHWLSDAIGRARATRDAAAFEAWMRAAPLWRGYVPPGKLGDEALHFGIAPSVDRAGRLFAIAAGVAGDPPAVWGHASAAGDAVDTAIYDALAGGVDADATVAALAASRGAERIVDVPAVSTWWRDPRGTPELESETVNSALLERLLGAAVPV